MKYTVYDRAINRILANRIIAAISSPLRLAQRVERAGPES